MVTNTTPQFYFRITFVNRFSKFDKSSCILKAKSGIQAITKLRVLFDKQLWDIESIERLPEGFIVFNGHVFPID